MKASKRRQEVRNVFILTVRQECQTFEIFAANFKLHLTYGFIQLKVSGI